MVAVDNYFNIMGRKKTNTDQKLLNEELKRYKQINGYDAEEGLITEMNFYQSIPEEFYGEEKDPEEDLLLGMSEADEEGGEEDLDGAIEEDDDE